MKTAGTNAQKAERIAHRAEFLKRLNDLGADAERYRWLTGGHTEAELRDPKSQPLNTAQMRVIAELSINYYTKVQTDSFIDNARALENQIDVERQCCSPHCAWTGFVKLVTDGGPRCPVCAERTMAVYP